MTESVAFTRLDPDAAERFTSLRRELGLSSLGLNQILLRPGERGRIHRHRAQDEVYLVVEGALTVVWDGGERTLGAGELARFAPDVRRQLVNRHRANCLLVAIGAAGEHEGRDGTAFTDWSDEAGGAPQEIPLPADLPESELLDE